MDKKLAKYLQGVDPSRREAIKKLVMGTAFVVPAVASFSLSAQAACLPGQAKDIGGSFISNITGYPNPAESAPGNNCFVANSHFPS